MFVCSICNLFGGHTFAAVLRHIGEIHRYDPGLVIRCGIGQCPQTYTKYESFRSHVYRKHRETIHSLSSANSASEGVCNFPESTEYYNQGDDVMSDIQAIEASAPDVKQSGAMFLLKTREEHRIPQSTLNKIVNDMKGLWMSSIELVRGNVKRSMCHSNKEAECEKLMKSLDDSFPLIGLETEYLQLNYYKEHFNYLEPTERVLNPFIAETSDQSKELGDRCYDISLIDSLQQLLLMDSVQEQIRNSHALANGLLGDYCDGEGFHNNQLFQEDPSALQVQLYYDELEVCNPLGSKVKKHKLGILYYTLGNLSPKLRSSLKSIHLLSIAKYEIICKYGIENLLKPVVDDVLKLERDVGVEFMIDGSSFSCRGTVTVFSADNLAAWAIGGYKALASAFRKCQYCMVTDMEMQIEFSERNLHLRTKEMYTAHCADLGGPLHDHVAITYGIVRNSILNSLNHFHVVTGLVPDIMHNILEGTLELCMRHLLIQCVTVDRLFTLKLLNQRLSAFNYGPDTTNKPSQLSQHHISASGHIKQSASQMWCLGRFLPVLIGDKVPENYPYWENFLAHLEIVDEVFAPIISEDRLEYLSMLIEDYLEDFRALYSRPLTPKMHYLIHVPTWIKRCGPLIKLWCMRYEAKHSFFKHLSNILRNFTNIPKTLSARHQRYMCYHMLEPTTYLRHRVVYTGVSSVNVSDMEYSEEIVAAIPNLVSDDAALWRARSATLNGTTYKKEHVIVCGMTEEDPTFGQIMDIFQSPTEETLFVMRMLSVSHYNTHYHAYEVHLTHCVVVYTSNEFVDHHPLHVCKSFGINRSLFVTMKYHIHSNSL